MATKNIAWSKGTGNITLSYTGQGNDIVIVTSDPNDVYEDRSQTITFSSTSYLLSTQVTVTQGMKHPNFETSQGYWFVTSDDKYLTVQE